MTKINENITLGKNKGKIKSEAVELNGIKFRSKLEQYCYQKLLENNIKVKYEKKTFTVLKPFKYKGDKIKKITYTPDFVGDTFVIECKGWMNESFPLRWKLFLNYLHNSGSKYDVYLPRNKKDVDIVISKIKTKLNTSTKLVTKIKRKIKNQLLCFYI